MVLQGLLAGVAAAAPSTFALEWSEGAITSLRRAEDAHDTQYVKPGARLGDVQLAYRRAEDAWERVSTTELVESAEVTADDTLHETSYRVKDALEVTVGFDVSEEAVVWRVETRNLTDEPLEIGDLALPLPMNSSFQKENPSFSVLKHSFVSGHGSFLFWMRSNSVPPYLLMTTLGDTSLEYWDVTPERRRDRTYRVYLHSAVAGAEAETHGGVWRQPHTSLPLAPAGEPGDVATYAFKLQWADSYDDVREKLIAEGAVDVHVAPGMTVPSDLTTQLALRSKEPIEGVEAEHPDETEVEWLPTNGDFQRLRVRFGKLGENRLKLSYDNGKHVYLEYFATEPVETLIMKRAAFIARCQHDDPSKWYNGLISEWNNETGVLLGPDNYDRIKGWRIYEVTCDDPGLCKPAFLAAKNAEFAIQEEVTALDDYIEHFVWGGLQRTTEESYSYGIYGIPDWKQNRTSDDPGERGRLHLWRTYDYPHIVLMYHSMYRVAKENPQIETRLSAEEYLERAYGTARAMFTVPWSIVKWSGYPTGYYNELVLTDLIDALEEEGRRAEADLVRQCWENKVRYFVGGEADLFQSEYPFDSTGFESTHALARYAVDHASEADNEELGYTPDDAWEFMENQLAANRFCRGVIEPAYYYLGSDYRGGAGNRYTLTYMSQMAGWSLLDYALHYAEDPWPDLRLGYASILSSWALMNTGTPESDYGYWFPGEANDGAAGGGFEPASYGYTWLEQPHHRGTWYYSCEIDLGFCGALRAAATVLADDPVFGRTCFGGTWEESGDEIAVFPKDGLRRRFHALLGESRLHVSINRGRFVADEPLQIGSDLSALSCEIEGKSAESAGVLVTVSGLADGAWIAKIDGDELERFTVKNGEAKRLAFDIASDRVELSLSKAR